MRWSLLLGLIGACTATDDDKPTTPADDDDGGTSPTADTSTEPVSGYFEPVAVGFEFDGVILPDGTPASFLFDDPDDGLTYERYPYILVTFAALDYFEVQGASEEQIAGWTCSVASVAPWTPAALTSLSQIPTHDGALLHWSYDVALDLEIDPDSTDCDEELDPAVWGEDAVDLLEAFDGMHFGYGWGQQTEYLTEPFDQTTTEDEEFMSAWLASYVAINDAAGEWLAYDWTFGFAFEWDIETGYLVTVPDPDPPATYPDRQLLVRYPVTDIPAGDPLPPMYIRSSAYWYQDFPLMDLTNLKDGAP